MFGRTPVPETQLNCFKFQNQSNEFLNEPVRLLGPAKCFQNAPPVPVHSDEKFLLRLAKVRQPTKAGLGEAAPHLQ